MKELKNYLLGDYRDMMKRVDQTLRYGANKMPPLIISCAVTGGNQGAESCPGLPESLEDQVQSSYDAYNAGASLVHIHRRDPNNLGDVSDRWEDYYEVNHYIREKCPDLIINNTIIGCHNVDMKTGNIGKPLDVAIPAKPEVGSVDIYSTSGILPLKPRTAPLQPRPQDFREYNFYMPAATCTDILSAMLGGIIHRARTGEGIRLTTSLYANGLWCNFTHLIAAQDHYQGIFLPREYDSDRNPIGSRYQCRDGRWLLLQAGYPRQYVECMDALELNEYIDDPRFATWEDLCENHKDLFRIITDQMKTKDSKYWADRLLERDVVYMEMATTNEASKSEQAWANGYLTHMKFPNGNECVVPNNPVTFYGCEKVESRHAGPVGADTAEILARLGYSDEQMEALAAKGVIVK